MLHHESEIIKREGNLLFSPIQIRNEIRFDKKKCTNYIKQIIKHDYGINWL